jgi:RecB family exonuclease
MTAIAVDHLSHSQVQTYMACPRQWTYSKIEHAPREQVGVALVLGSAVHAALALANEAALHGERIDAGAAFATAWKQAVAEAAAPIHYGADAPDDVLAKGRALAAAYEPPPGIVGVEQAFDLMLDPALPPITGRIDLIRRNEAGELVLADIKTSASRTLSDTAAVEAQLGLYDLAYPAAQHEVVVIAKLKQPVVTVQSVTPWPQARLVRTYTEVHQAMVAGIRFAHRSWACASCSFAGRCRAEG